MYYARFYYAYQVIRFIRDNKLSQRRFSALLAHHCSILF